MATSFTHIDCGEVETTESYFSNQYFNARVKSGNESNSEYDQILEVGRDEEWLACHWKEIRENELKYEEDVNQYLILMLAGLAHPPSMDMINEYLIGRDSDVGQVAVSLRENSKKYYLYKINADFMLLNLGLFPQPIGQQYDAYFDRGETYYYSAANNLKRIQGGSTGLSDVLEKLSSKFGTYVEILRYMKSHAENYLSFHFKFSEAEFENIQQNLMQVKQDEKRNQDPPTE